MQQVETSAAVLISSLQNQTDYLNQNLSRLQDAHNTLQDLSNEGHLDFIMVGSLFEPLTNPLSSMSQDQPVSSSVYRNMDQLLQGNKHVSNQ